MTSTERYRADPEFRRRVIKSTREYHLRSLKVPGYKRLTYLRKRIYELREKLDRHIANIERWEKSLLSYVKERDELVVKVRDARSETRQRRLQRADSRLSKHHTG